MKTVTYRLFLVLLSPLPGCGQSDLNMWNHETYNKLCVLSDHIRTVDRIGVSLHFKSYDELLDLLQERKLIRMLERERLERDSWENGFVFLKGDADGVFRVLSFGANGISDSGEGDDLYLEVKKKQD